MDTQKMKNDTGDALERALGRLEMSIQSALDMCETPMAANMKLMAVMADAFYIYKNAEALFESWKRGLFFIGDTGSVVCLEAWASRLEDAVLSLEQHVKKNPLFPSFHVHVVRGYDEEGKEIKWRVWNNEAMAGRDKDDDQKIDEDAYGALIEPTASQNLWYFFNQEVKQVAGYDMKDRKEFFRDISLGGGKLWLPQLHKEVKKLCTQLMEMEDMKKGLYRTMKPKEQNQAMENLYTRIKKDFEEQEKKRVEDDFNLWMTGYQGGVTSGQLEKKLMREFGRLLDSGFLASFLVDYDCPSGDVEKAYALFQTHFCDAEKNIRPSAIGRYIYIRQFMEEDWYGKTMAFFRFMLTEELVKHSVGTEEKKGMFHRSLDPLKVEEGLRKLLAMRNAKDEIIFRNQKIWYVIYRVFERMGWLANLSQTDFRDWAQKTYGAPLGFSTKGDFDAMNGSVSRECADRAWALNHKDDNKYAVMSLALWEEFQGEGGENEELYRKPGKPRIYKP